MKRVAILAAASISVMMMGCTTAAPPPPPPPTFVAVAPNTWHVVSNACVVDLNNASRFFHPGPAGPVTITDLGNMNYMFSYPGQAIIVPIHPWAFAAQTLGPPVSDCLSASVFPA